MTDGPDPAPTPGTCPHRFPHRRRQQPAHQHQESAWEVEHSDRKAAQHHKRAREAPRSDPRRAFKKEHRYQGRSRDRQLRPRRAVGKVGNRCVGDAEACPGFATYGLCESGGYSYLQESPRVFQTPHQMKTRNHAGSLENSSNPLINGARRGLAPPSLIEPLTNHQPARRGRWCLSPRVRARAVIFILAGVASGDMAQSCPHPLHIFCQRYP